MRFEGTVKSWNDDRAFGFIEPSQGGQEIFLHITALPARASRPALSQRVTFELELNRDGKKRAKNVQFAQTPRSPRPQRSRQPPIHRPMGWRHAVCDSRFSAGVPGRRLVLACALGRWRRVCRRECDVLPHLRQRQICRQIRRLAHAGKHPAPARSAGRLARRFAGAAVLAPQVHQSIISRCVLGNGNAST